MIISLPTGRQVQLYFTQDSVNKTTKASLYFNVSETTYMDGTHIKDCEVHKTAYCHPKDNFLKKYGRKYSLAKVFKECENYFTKEEKREIWKRALPKDNHDKKPNKRGT